MNSLWDTLPFDTQELILKKAEELPYSDWLNDFNNIDDVIYTKWRNMNHGLFLDVTTGYIIYTLDHSEDR